MPAKKANIKHTCSLPKDQTPSQPVSLILQSESENDIKTSVEWTYSQMAGKINKTSVVPTKSYLRSKYLQQKDSAVFFLCFARGNRGGATCLSFIWDLGSDCLKANPWWKQRQQAFCLPVQVFFFFYKEADMQKPKCSTNMATNSWIHCSVDLFPEYSSKIVSDQQNSLKHWYITWI